MEDLLCKFYSNIKEIKLFVMSLSAIGNVRAAF